MKKIALLILVVSVFFGFTEKPTPKSYRPTDLPKEIAVFTKCHPETSTMYSFQLVSREEKENFGIVSDAYHYSDENGHDLFMTVNYGAGIMGDADSTHHSMVITLDCR